MVVLSENNFVDALTNIIQDIQDLYFSYLVLNNKKIKLCITNIGLNEKYFVKSDYSKLELCLYNLMDNAILFSSPNSVIDINVILSEGDLIIL